jgi:indolepyruvate ferredoxin oxidoreductase, alpha subunit
MNKEILMGDEAIGLAALHAGIRGAYSYPGTPATEILEYIQRTTIKGRQVESSWSANEKVAFEEALGMSFAGGRALVSMKHVGLNVAADPFMNSSITGVDGGVVVVVCDDPGMHSSQNEQDSRYYAEFALIPCFEPSNQQEAYEMTREAFVYSEQVKLPVLIRLTTRLAHSRAQVETSKMDPQNKIKATVDFSHWTLLPGNARKQYAQLTETQAELIEHSKASRFNQLKLEGEKGGNGIIVSGIAYNYLMEYLSTQHLDLSILKISTYPIPDQILQSFFEHVGDVLILEEGYPFIEKQLRVLQTIAGKKILGKLTETVPRTGELNTDIIRYVFEKTKLVPPKIDDTVLVPRPPQLCKGCPHIDSFQALTDALEKTKSARVFSDIGCYTLGYYPPYSAIHSCVDMGASITMAIGAAQAGVHPSLAVIGESTFCHSGMTGLLDATYKNVPITLLLLDNSAVAMTGGQDNILAGKSLVEIVKALGVDPTHVHEVEAKRTLHEANVELIKKEMDYKGVSVIILVRECIQTAVKKKKSAS